MTKSFIVSQSAENDIDEILDYIAADNLSAALDMEDNLYDAFQKLAESPGLGRKRPEWTKKPYHFWLVRSRYYVIYKVDKPLQIVRIVNAVRDIPALLEDS